MAASSWLVTIGTGGGIPVVPPGTDPTPVGSDTAWTLVWNDEFTGTSVDTTSWRIRNNTSNSNEQSYLLAANVSVGSDLLVIEGRLESVGGKSFTSGYLDTIGKKSWTYGFFEAKIKMPTQAGSSKGMWPAFWLRPDDGGNGELDIVEAYGNPGGDGHETNEAHQTIWRDYTGTPKQGVVYTLPAGGVTAGWHTYGVDWSATALKWYVDGVLVFTRTPATTSWYADAFVGRPFNIRLNLQIGSSYAGTPDASNQWPADMVVDYVRVWQRG